MLIRTLTEEDLDVLWALRLRALQDDPEAFGSTYAESLAAGDSRLRQRLLQPEEETFCLGAYNDPLIGMVWLTREQSTKDRHKGTITGMYVLPERRGQGVGRVLLRELIARARRLEGLEQLHLSVVTSNAAALALYRSVGFVDYGTEPHALKQGEQYWDEALMVRFLQ